MARKETKKAVSKVNTKALNSLYQYLGTKQGQKSIYKLAKCREKKKTNLEQVKYVIP